MTLIRSGPMLGAALAVLISTALGALLGIPGGALRRFTPTIQTFALSAGVAVVVLHLLPAALGGLGVSALGLLVLGLVLPSVLARLLGRGELGDHTADDRVSLELGYLGLLLHKVGDGLALGTFHLGAHAGHAHVDLNVALGAHAVPVTALVTLAFWSRSGVRPALWRALGMALAGLLGLWSTSLVPTDLVENVEPYVASLTAGLLLHVIAHDWQGEIPRTTATRSSDLLAMIAGVALCSLGGHGHEDGHEHDRLLGDLASAFGDLVLDTAPTLLLGLLIGAVLQTFGTRIPASFLRGGGPLKQAVKGSLLGAPLPVCACGVLPIADSLRQRRASAALVIAFLLATPELGVETLALTARFMGWPFAAFRLGAALAVAVAAALLVSRARPGGESKRDLQGDEPIGVDIPTGHFGRTLGYFDELLYHTGPWTLVGLFAAACVQVSLPEGSLGAWARGGLDVVLVSVLAVPSYVCAAAATPLGAVMLAKGFSKGAVLAGLLLGPATNVATVAFLRRVYGAHTAAWLLGGVLVTTWVLAMALNGIDLPLTLERVGGDSHEVSLWTWLATGTLGLFVLRAMWRDGARAWLAALGEAIGSDRGGGHGHGHGHVHGHGDGHGHGHGHGHDQGGV